MLCFMLMLSVSFISFFVFVNMHDIQIGGKLVNLLISLINIP